jgi:hypothetical protein
MATVIDELIVKLGLDATGLRQGQATVSSVMRSMQEGAQRYAHSIANSTNVAQRTLATLRFSYEALGVAALAAFTKAAEFAERVAAQNVILAANAAAVRETTEEYSALSRAMESVVPGGGAGFQRTVQNITNALAETRYTGRPTGIAQAAVTFGLPLTEATVDTSTGLVRRHYKDAEKLAFDFVDKLKAQGKDYADAVWWAERYGVDRTLVYMRYKLSEEQQRHILAQQRMNALTKEQADASQEVWIKWNDLTGTLSRIDNELLVAFKGQILAIIGAAERLAPIIKDWVVSLTTKIPDDGIFGSLNKSLESMHSFSKQMHDIWPKIGAAIEAALAPIIHFLQNIGVLPKDFSLNKPEIEGAVGPGLEPGASVGTPPPGESKGKNLDDQLGTGPGGWLDRATGGAITRWHDSVVPGEGGTSPTGPQSALPPVSGGVDRSRFAGVVNDPALVYRMADMVAGEVGKSAPVESQKVMLETMFNRAQRRDIPVQQALLSVAQDPRRGYYARDTYRNQVTAADLEKFKKDVLAPVLAGSDSARGFTGNASGSVAMHQRMRGTPAFPIQAAGGQTEWIFDEDRRRASVPHLPQNDPSTRPSVPAVGDSRWNGAPLSAVSMWGAGGGSSSTTNDNSRSAEANINVMNIYSGHSTMTGVGQDAGHAVAQSMVAGHAEGGPQ